MSARDVTPGRLEKGCCGVVLVWALRPCGPAPCRAPGWGACSLWGTGLGDLLPAGHRVAPGKDSSWAAAGFGEKFFPLVNLGRWYAGRSVPRPAGGNPGQWQPAHTSLGEGRPCRAGHRFRLSCCCCSGDSLRSRGRGRSGDRAAGWPHPSRLQHSFLCSSFPAPCGLRQACGERVSQHLDPRMCLCMS